MLKMNQWFNSKIIIEKDENRKALIERFKD